MESPQILQHVNSLFNSVSYAFNGILLDPGDVWDGFEDVSKVLLTHGHFDHIYGLNELMKISSSAIIYTNEFGREMLLNARKNLSLYHETPFEFFYPESIVIVKDGDEIILDNGVSAKAIFTPGHNPSCICWTIEDVIFTGDSYIPGNKTITNLPGGNKVNAMESQKLMIQHSFGRIIHPGHKI